MIIRFGDRASFQAIDILRRLLLIEFGEQFTIAFLYNTEFSSVLGRFRSLNLVGYTEFSRQTEQLGKGE